MPVSGTWTVQNKQRPGAYINFVSVPKPVGPIGSRGVMICALPMTWGPTNKLITLYGDDLLNGQSISKVGCDAYDVEESLPYRLALAGCYKALLFRLDIGGSKATASISADLTVNAKYPGSTGNNISISITRPNLEAEQYIVEVRFKNAKRESFVVSSAEELKAIESEWVDFVGTGSTIPDTAGITLENGVNGQTSADLENFFNLASGETWNCLAVNSVEETVQTAIAEFIMMMRDTRGKKVQGVVYNYAEANHEGIISVHQGFTTSKDTVGVDLFPVYVASMTAGANINESITAKVIEDAKTIIEPVAEDKVEDALRAGKFLLTYRQDGAVCMEKDINTLSTFTVDKGDAFSKNRIVRCLDEIGNTVALIFNRNYCGKIDNNEIGRNMYKVELISMMDQLVDMGAIQNFKGAEDITILPGEDIDSVVVDMVIQPVHSIEKMYMTVNVNA